MAEGDCFASLAMTALSCHCEERSDEAISSPMRRSNSVRRPAQGADLGELARQFRPALAGILGLVEFAVMATRDDEPGIGWMRRESPDRRVRLHRQFRHPPILAAVGRALDRAGRAHRAVAGCDKQRIGIIRLLRQAAAIGQGELVANPKPGPAFALVMACEDLARRRRQHRGAAIDDNPDVVNVRVVDPLCDPPPAVAAIGALQYPADLHTGPHRLLVGRSVVLYPVLRPASHGASY